MGGSRANPNSTRKRPKWKDVKKITYTYLQMIEAFMKDLQTHFRYIPTKFALHEIEKLVEYIENTCHKAAKEYPEFGRILEDRIINAIQGIPTYARKGNKDEVVKLYALTLTRLDECRRSLRHLSHIMRYNEFQQRMRHTYFYNGLPFDNGEAINNRLNVLVQYSIGLNHNGEIRKPSRQRMEDITTKLINRCSFSKNKKEADLLEPLFNLRKILRKPESTNEEIRTALGKVFK